MNPFFFFSRPWPATALAVLMCFCAPAAQAQSIANSGALSFGAFVAGSGGSVVVAPNGGRSRSGVMLVQQGSTISAAQFTINGTVASITLPSDQGGSGDITLTREGGTETMLVNSFTRSFVAPLLHVGATLTVGAAQPPGSYTGSFDVIVNYE